MRLLHISETDYEGGAGLAAHALHLALRQKGVESFFLAECARSRDPCTATISGLRGVPARILRRLRVTLDLLPLRRYPRRQPAAWSVGRLPRRVARIVARLRPGIVHLHWIGAALSVRAIGDLPGTTVWTHHDWGAFTGGCRCPADCRRFVSGCGACPLLGSRKEDDLSARTCRRKQRLWQGARFRSVAVGSGIARDVRDSLLLGRHPCTVIPNGIDTERFRPLDQARAREALGIDPRAFIVFCGAYTLDAPLKGARERPAALALWRRRHSAARVCVVLAGHGRLPGIEAAGLPTRHIGFLASPEEMAVAYNAADVVVVPSRVESFGLVAAEAQACGVPVTAFAGTGTSDIVRHGDTGFLARDFSAEELAEGIAWAMALSPSERARIASAARRNVLARFSLPAVAEAHLALYREIAAEDR